MWMPIVTPAAAIGRADRAVMAAKPSPREPPDRRESCSSSSRSPGPTPTAPGARRAPPLPRPPTRLRAPRCRRRRTSSAARSRRRAPPDTTRKRASRSVPPRAQAGIQSTPLMCPVNSVGMRSSPARQASVGHRDQAVEHHGVDTIRLRLERLPQQEAADRVEPGGGDPREVAGDLRLVEQPSTTASRSGRASS